MNSIWQVFWACIPKGSLKARLGHLIFHWRRLDTLVVEYKESLLRNSYMMLRQLPKLAAEWILAEKRPSSINAGPESSIGSQEFKYEKITKSRQIKLLKLPRQKSRDEVWCEIIAVSLDPPPPPLLTMRSHIPGVLVRKRTKYSFRELDAPSLRLFMKYCKDGGPFGQQSGFGLILFA